MAKIVYGVAGEGFGHSSRSELIGQHLIDAGHEVLFAASRKSFDYLKPTFDERVLPVHGLSFHYQNGRVDPVRTVAQNLRGYLPAGLAANRRLFAGPVKAFAPDLVISDFEPFSAWWAWRNGIPCVSVNHEHLLSCCRFETDGAAFRERALANIVMRGYHTFADAYVVINFFKTPLRNKNARLVPPVVRRRVLAMRPTAGEHILMYSTDGGPAMRQRLYDIVSAQTDHRFVIYGFNEDRQQGNCRFKKTNTDTFLADLASCRAVVATAGFSLLSECLHFRKPMLLMPVGDQQEQIVNACYIEKLGMGLKTNALGAPVLEDFLGRLETFRFDHPLAMLPDNAANLRMLDETFAMLGFDLRLKPAGPVAETLQQPLHLFDRPRWNAACGLL